LFSQISRQPSDFRLKIAKFCFKVMAATGNFSRSPGGRGEKRQGKFQFVRAMLQKMASGPGGSPAVAASTIISHDVIGYVSGDQSAFFNP
jgi:hypothetical protein